MLEFLDGISPIWWLIAALAIGAVEMLSATTYLLWPALSALAVSGLLVVFPELSGEAQASLFAVLGVLLTVAGRFLVQRIGGGQKSADTLNEPAKRAVGGHGEVIEFKNGAGTILVCGVRWQARSNSDFEPAAGDRVRVIAAEGSSLVIDRLQQSN